MLQRIAVGFVVGIAAVVYGCIGGGSTPVPAAPAPSWYDPCSDLPVMCASPVIEDPAQPTVQYPIVIAKYNFNTVETYQAPRSCTLSPDPCGADMFELRTRTVTNYYFRWQQCEGCAPTDLATNPTNWNASTAPVINPP